MIKHGYDSVQGRENLVEFCLRSRAKMLSLLPSRLDSGLFVDCLSRSHSSGDRALTKLGSPDKNLQIRRGVAK